MKHFERNLFYVLNIMVPICSGGMIYVFFRRDTYISQAVSQLMGLNLNDIRIPPDGWGSFLRSFFSDMMWAYALTFAIILFQEERHKYWITLMECVLFECMIEFAQRWDIIGGTFDLYDIVLEVLSNVIAILLIYIYERWKTYET